jgi:hypothetical protein
MTPNMEQEVQWLKDAIANIGKEFTRPDDDWEGVMFFWGEEGTTSLLPLMFRNEDEKNMIATVAIPLLIRNLKPWLVAQVHSAWTISIKKEKFEAEDTPLPSAHPDREESLILIANTIDQMQFWQAKIIRFPNRPPALAPWTLWPQPDGTEGRFITPVIETMKEVHG